MRNYFILLMMVFFVPLSLSAQKLNIDKVLDGRYKKNPNTTDVVYSGEKLFNLPIEYYHSLTVVNDEQIMNAIVSAFLADEKTTSNKEITKVGSQLFYGFCQMKFNGETNRFIIIKDMRYAPKQRKQQLILIYMEGYCSAEKIKNMFKKK